MAYATLLDEDYLVRLTGQDVGHLALSHIVMRYCTVKDAVAYVPLLTIRPEAHRFALYDSLIIRRSGFGI